MIIYNCPWFQQRSYDHDFVYEYDNSNTYAVHEKCSEDDSQRYSYLLEDKDGSVTDARTKCRNHGNTANHCTIFTFKGQPRTSDMVVDNRCIQGQCV